MLLLFFVVWLIFNGRITLEIALFGVAISLLVFAFICKFMNYSWEKEKLVYKRMPLYLAYLAVLLKEIVLANLSAAKLILSRREVVEPVIVRFKTSLKSEVSKVVLANSITLTPGTITVSLVEDELVVHCLDKSLAEGMEDSVFVKLLEKMEES